MLYALLLLRLREKTSLKMKNALNDQGKLALIQNYFESLFDGDEVIESLDFQ